MKSFIRALLLVGVGVAVGLLLSGRSRPNPDDVPESLSIMRPGGVAQSEKFRVVRYAYGNSDPVDLTPARTNDLYRVVIKGRTGLVVYCEKTER